MAEKTGKMPKKSDIFLNIEFLKKIIQKVYKIPYLSYKNIGISLKLRSQEIITAQTLIKNGPFTLQKNGFNKKNIQDMLNTFYILSEKVNIFYLGAPPPLDSGHSFDALPNCAANTCIEKWYSLNKL